VGGDDPIGAIADLLARAGCGRPAVVSLTRAELGVPVVRVVVPGLEGPYQEDGGEFLPGARARGAPSWPIFP
jgi:ribosomal protein S12 methylthiotransferase accessory factor